MKNINSLEYIPLNIKKYIENHTYRLDNIGMESSQVFIYDHLNLVLKVNQNMNDYLSELEMMKWLDGKLLVPKVIEYGESNDLYYLLMTKIDGLMSLDEGLIRNPEALIDTLVDGIKSFWKLPVDQCPIDNRIQNKLKIAKYNIENNLVDIKDWDDEIIQGRFHTPMELYDYLLINQMEEELVVSHGDFCLPNIFIKDQKINGFIDLSRAGVADIYQDISLLIRSFNFNAKSNDYKKTIINKLGIKFDVKKCDYYLLLDELF